MGHCQVFHSNAPEFKENGSLNAKAHYSAAFLLSVFSPRTASVLAPNGAPGHFSKEQG